MLMVSFKLGAVIECVEAALSPGAAWSDLVKSSSRASFVLGNISAYNRRNILADYL